MLFRSELEDLITTVDIAAETTAQQIIKDGEAAKGKGKSTESTKAHTAAVKEDTAALAAQAAATKANADIEAAARATQMTTLEQLLAARQAEYAQIAANYKVSGDAAQAESAYWAVASKYAKDLTALREQEIAAMRALGEQTEVKIGRAHV